MRARRANFESWNSFWRSTHEIVPVKSTKMFKLRLLFSNGNQDQREGERNSGAYIPGVKQQQRLKPTIYLHEPKKGHWAAKPLKSIEDVYFSCLQSNLIWTPLSQRGRPRLKHRTNSNRPRLDTMQPHMHTKTGLTQTDPDSNTTQTQTDPDSTPRNNTCKPVEKEESVDREYNIWYI